MPGWLMRAMILSCRYHTGHCHTRSCCHQGLWAWVQVLIPPGHSLQEHMLGKGKSQGKVWASAWEYRNCPFHGQVGISKSRME